MPDTKKFLDIEGVKILWNQANLNDYPNNQTLIAVLNAIDETKQDKAIIVTKDSNGLATLSASEIWNLIQVGTSVYYTEATTGGTLHPFLEGSQDYACFYSNFIDNTRLLGTYIQIDNNKTIETSNYSFSNIDTTLTKSGAAADAKTVGDLLSSISVSQEALLKTEQSLTENEISQVYNNLQLNNNFASIEYVDEKIGDLETILQSI